MFDDGSDKPLGYTTPDGELEVRPNADGGRGYHETELGQHMRWMRQAPDLFEKYQQLQAQLSKSAAPAEPPSRATTRPDCDHGDCKDHYGDSAAWCGRCRRNAEPPSRAAAPQELTEAIYDECMKVETGQAWARDCIRRIAGLIEATRTASPQESPTPAAICRLSQQWDEPCEHRTNCAKCEDKECDHGGFGFRDHAFKPAAEGQE